MDSSTLEQDADRRNRLVAGLLELLDQAGRGKSWTPSPAFERAVVRWSQGAKSPIDVLVLVAEVRRSRRSTPARDALLEHLSLVAVAAVSERMVSEALTDPLTGLATRARLDEEVQHLLAASLRHGTPLTAVVMDVDGLKRINDTQGHAAGDAAIAELGRAIRATLRKVDRAFRVGGDEFALVLPDTTAEAARSVVERIQQSCATSFSVGVTTHSGAQWDSDVATWLQEADDAMYEQRQLLRGLCAPTSPRRSNKARAAGIVLATGLSLGAWAGIAMAVHGVVADDAPATKTGSSQAVPPTAQVGGGSGTVALPRGVAPHVLPEQVPPATAPRATTPTPAPAVQVPVVEPPFVDVPTVRVPQVQVPPVVPPTVEPAPAAPPSALPGLLDGLLRTVGGLLKPILG